MILKAIRGATLAYLTVFCLIAHAEIPSETADRLLKLSGVVEQVQLFPDALSASMMQAQMQSGQKIPDAVFQTILGSIGEVANPAEIIANVTKTLEKNLTPDEVEHLLSWYRSRQGMQITTGEIFASSADALRYVANNQPQLLEDTQRVAIAKKLDKLLGLTEKSMELGKYSMVASFVAVSLALQPGVQPNLKALEALSKKSMFASRNDIESHITATSVYSYQDIPLETLDEYIDFVGHPKTRNFNELVGNSLLQGFEDVVTRLADKMAEAFSQKAQSS